MLVLRKTSTETKPHQHRHHKSLYLQLLKIKTQISITCHEPDKTSPILQPPRQIHHSSLLASIEPSREAPCRILPHHICNHSQEEWSLLESISAGKEGMRIFVRERFLQTCSRDLESTGGSWAGWMCWRL